MIETHTVEAVAEKFGLSPATALKRCTSGAWPHHKEGRHIYFTSDDVEQIVSAGAVQVKKPQTGQTHRSQLAAAKKAS